MLLVHLLDVGSAVGIDVGAAIGAAVGAADGAAVGAAVGDDGLGVILHTPTVIIVLSTLIICPFETR